ncbi:MAG: hypothetical protein K2M89_06280 [Clostridiales bacterium]|nr:hypothetical protein [Clostridiales bacterium]
MKSIIRSAKPYWIYLILTGKKTVEVGKEYPKAADWNKTVEMYCSKDMRSFNRIPEKDRAWMRKYLGKVACRFVCDKVDKYNYHKGLTKFGGELGLPIGTYDSYLIFEDDYKAMCLTYDEVKSYGGGKPLYGLHITDLKIYDKPKELGEFKKTVKKCTNDVWYRVKESPTCPPQSYYYVEELRG